MELFLFTRILRDMKKEYEILKNLSAPKRLVQNAFGYSCSKLLRNLFSWISSRERVAMSSPRRVSLMFRRSRPVRAPPEPRCHRPGLRARRLIWCELHGSQTIRPIQKSSSFINYFPHNSDGDEYSRESYTRPEPGAVSELDNWQWMT